MYALDFALILWMPFVSITPQVLLLPVGYFVDVGLDFVELYVMIKYSTLATMEYCKPEA